MKVYPPEFNDCELMPLVGQHLIACDHCGIVSVDTPRFGWQRWTDENGVQRHHCASAAEYNEWVRNSLVHNVAPESAIEYEQWDDHPTDEQPEQIPAVMSEAVDVAEGATEFLSERGVFEKAHDEQTEAEFLGYAQTPISEEAEKPTAATDADFFNPRVGGFQPEIYDGPTYDPPVVQGDSAVAGVVHEAEQWESEREREDYGPNGPGGHI